jgi:Holliday junction DNA helicase RuvA
MAYITHLNGILIEKLPTGLVLECAGVGYAIAVPLSTFDRLPATGESCKLYTSHLIREDDELLFGFATAREREFFQTLLTISGVGPKLALNVLSGLTPGELATAISEGDVKRLSSISGVGKKTAERIIVELKDKIDPLDAIALRHKEKQTSDAPAALRDAILSLVALGNKPEEAQKMAQAAYEANSKANVQELIRLALRR